MRWRWLLQNLLGGPRALPGAVQRLWELLLGAGVRVKQGLEVAREDIVALLGPCPAPRQGAISAKDAEVLLYRQAVAPEFCQQVAKVLATGSFQAWRLGLDPSAPASDYQKLGYTKTDVYVQQGVRMRASEPAPESYLEAAEATEGWLRQAFQGDFILDRLAAALEPCGVSLRPERCCRSRRRFLPCVLRRMEPGGRRKEGNVHMDTLRPGATLSLNLSLGSI